MAKTIYNKIKSGKIPVIKKELEEGVIAEANRDGSIYVDKDIKKNSPLEKEAIAHEKVHLDQMQRGDLDYDDNSVYWKGKKYSRQKMNEGSKQLPWEKEAYNKTKHMKKSKNSAVKMSDADLVANNTQTHKKFQNLGSIAFDAAEEGFKGTQERFKNMPLPSKPEDDAPTQMRSTPITKKAKSSPFKVNDGTEASKKITKTRAKDSEGNLGTATITVGSTAPIVSYRTKSSQGSYQKVYDTFKTNDKGQKINPINGNVYNSVADFEKDAKDNPAKKEKVVTKGKSDVSSEFEKDQQENPGSLNPGYYQSIDGKYAEAVRRRDAKGDMRRDVANRKKYDRLQKRAQKQVDRQVKKFNKNPDNEGFEFSSDDLKKTNAMYKLGANADNNKTLTSITVGGGGDMPEAKTTYKFNPNVSQDDFVKSRIGKQYDDNTLINKRSNPTTSNVAAGEDVQTIQQAEQNALNANTEDSPGEMNKKNKNKGPFKMKGFSGLQN